MIDQVQIRVNVSSPTGCLEHHWNYIGYDECNYTHSPGGMALLRKIGELEQPFYIRAHHLLCTGICHGFYKWGSTNIYTESPDGRPVYDFGTLDRIIDIWLQNHCIPFLELGFMPKDLADSREAENGESYSAVYGSVSEYRLRGWCQPPKDYGRWYDLIYTLALHLLDRYGLREVEKWYFELWNEPDIFYWHGTTEEYCRLFDYTEAALHRAIPSARLGGPATTGTDNPDGKASRFLRAFLAHVRHGTNACSGKTGTRLDFTSFHTKGGNYQFSALAEKQIPSVRTFLANVRTQCAIIREYGFDNLECVLSEADPDGWAAGGRFDNFNLYFRNTEYYASFMISAYRNLFLLASELKMDIRPLAWSFMFEGERCFEGTRSLATQGIDKPVLNLFRLLSRLGSQQVELRVVPAENLPVSASPSDDLPEIGGWAVADSPDLIQVLLYCHHDDWDRGGAYSLVLSLFGLPVEGPVLVTHYRIDRTHSNACTEWEQLGRPDWPDEQQRALIAARSGLEYLCPPEQMQVSGGRLDLTFSLPVHAVSLLEIRR